MRFSEYVRLGKIRINGRNSIYSLVGLISSDVRSTLWAISIGFIASYVSHLALWPTLGKVSQMWVKREIFSKFSSETGDAKIDFTRTNCSNGETSFFLREREGIVDSNLCLWCANWDLVLEKMIKFFTFPSNIRVLDNFVGEPIFLGGWGGLWPPRYPLWLHHWVAVKSLPHQFDRENISSFLQVFLTNLIWKWSLFYLNQIRWLEITDVKNRSSS